MIDIIIVSYNAVQSLERTLRSVYRHSAPGGYRITVVDNCSSDSTRRRLASFHPTVRVIPLDANVGFSAAANIGLRECKSSIVALLDDDVEVTKGWLRKASRHFRNDSSLGILTGKLLFPNRVIFSVGFLPDAMHSIGRGEVDRGQHDVVRKVDAVAGPCWLLRRKMFANVGDFDERYFPSQFEDFDYCLKARTAGYTIKVDGSIAIIHHCLFRTRGRSERNHRLFNRTWLSYLKRPYFRDTPAAQRYLALGLAELAQADSHRGSYKKAAKLLERAHNEDHALVSPFFLGKAHAGANNFPEAVTYFEESMRRYSPLLWRSRKLQYRFLRKQLEDQYRRTLAGAQLTRKMNSLSKFDRKLKSIPTGER